MTVLNDLIPLPPSIFFGTKLSIQKKKEGLELVKPDKPLISALLNEFTPIDTAIAWDDDALYLKLFSRNPFNEQDIFNLFIDTRDLKNSNVITKFCHHFLFFPYEQRGEEITKFRGEDTHKISSPSLLTTQTRQEKKMSTCKITINSEALYGYNPQEFNRMGLTFWFQSEKGLKTHLNLSSETMHIEKHPALWASVELEGNK